MARELIPGQSSRVRVHDIASGTATTVFESRSVLVEAPNWTADGTALVVNADGALFRLPLPGVVDGAVVQGADALDETHLERIPLDGVAVEINNDHVLTPDGSAAIVSSRDGHLYSVALDASRPARRLTGPTDPERRFKHYLHGISPDGSTLALIGGGLDDSGRWTTNVYTMPSDGGALKRLTDDAFPDDGVEFDHTGERLWFNSERASLSPGHAQLFRMRVDGTDLEQITDDERVNWFPHPSPDGRWVVYLSYAPGTLGHPENLPVSIRLLDLAAESTNRMREIVTLFGGQGTTNVNGWAPDSRRFAYVDFPVSTD